MIIFYFYFLCINLNIIRSHNLDHIETLNNRLLANYKRGFIIGEFSSFYIQIYNYIFQLKKYKSNSREI